MSTHPDRTTSSYALTHIEALVRSPKDVVRDATVITEDSRILFAGPRTDAPPLAASAEVVDCTGLTVIPGLVNSHNHVYEILYRGLGKQLVTEDWLKYLVYPANRVLTDIDFYHGAVLAIAEAVRTGTTSMVEQLTNFARFHADAEYDAFLTSGIRARIARASSTSSIIDPAEEGTASDELHAIDRFLDRWPRVGLVQPRVGPSGLFSCDADTLRQLKERADAAGLVMHIHLSESVRQQAFAEQNGYEGQIAWAADIGILDANTVVTHAIFATDREMDLLAERDVPVIHCPSSNMVTASGIAPVPALRARGVRVALGTDGPASNDSQDMVGEMRAAVLLHRAATRNIDILSATDVFAMATSIGGALIQPGLGVLQPGAPADLAAFALHDNVSTAPVFDPVSALVFAGSGRDAQLTMVDGTIVYRSGVYPTLDLDTSLGHVNDKVIPLLRSTLDAKAM